MQLPIYRLAPIFIFLGIFYSIPPGHAEVPASAKFGKVYEYINDPDLREDFNNAAQRFERDYFNFGAVTKEQFEEKKGHYFTFFWRPDRTLRPGRIEWEYYQEFDKNKLHKQVQNFTRAQSWQRSRFSVTGKDYDPSSKQASPETGGGRVISWRLRIFEGDNLVGETTSFVW